MDDKITRAGIINTSDTNKLNANRDEHHSEIHCAHLEQLISKFGMPIKVDDGEISANVDELLAWIEKNPASTSEIISDGSKALYVDMESNERENSRENSNNMIRTDYRHSVHEARYACQQFRNDTGALATGICTRSAHGDEFNASERSSVLSFSNAVLLAVLIIIGIFMNLAYFAELSDCVLDTLYDARTSITYDYPHGLSNPHNIPAPDDPGISIVPQSNVSPNVTIPDVNSGSNDDVIDPRDSNKFNFAK